MSKTDSNTNLNALLALLNKPVVTNVWYNSKEVKLDGYKFVSCRFDKCILVVTSTNFELIGCHIGEDTTIKFGSEIAKPIRLFNFRNREIYEQLPFFAPVLNADGTMTVTA